MNNIVTDPRTNLITDNVRNFMIIRIHGISINEFIPNKFSKIKLKKYRNVIKKLRDKINTEILENDKIESINIGKFFFLTYLIINITM